MHDQRPCDEPEHCHAPWHQLGSVHQVAKQQSVADADHKAWPQQKRPVLDCGEGIRDRTESRFTSCRGVPLQRHHRKHGQDPNQDERAFNEASGHVAERAYLVHALQQRIHDNGAYRCWR